MRLFTYCLRYDDGAAPNPFWGVCTLTICKPVIRRNAQIGDWVVGTGSTNSPQGDRSHSILYAMKVTGRLTLAQYDEHCRKHLPGKIPLWPNEDFARLVGDCLYDHTKIMDGKPAQRRGVHSMVNRDTDLDGKHALLSDEFYYWGDQAIDLPECLHPICHPMQGHKSNANAPHIPEFLTWLESLGLPKNTLVGRPQLQGHILASARAGVCAPCGRQDREEDEADEACRSC